MSIKIYLSDYLNHKTITLVGPMMLSNANFIEPVIFVDGGSKYRKNQQGYSLGDGDSHKGPLDYFLNPEKDVSDLSYVFSHLTENFSYIKLEGFLGGRRDHELINFGETHHLLKSKKSSTKISFEDCVIAVSAGKWKFYTMKLFSISVIQSTLIQITGNCKYQCKKPTMFHPFRSYGLSNEGFGTIFLDCLGPVFIFINE